MNQDIYEAAVARTLSFIKQSSARNELYVTWTEHTSTAGKVIRMFGEYLGELGVAGEEEKQPYLGKFKHRNGIDENYFG
jgi:hypothetical protein